LKYGIIEAANDRVGLEKGVEAVAPERDLPRLFVQKRAGNGLRAG
jgi:hypothetical protein